MKKEKEIAKFIILRLKKINQLKFLKVRAIETINILTDERIDSLQLMNLIVSIETKFNIKLNQQSFFDRKKLKLKDLIKIVSKKIK